MLTPTMPLRAAKHMALSCSVLSWALSCSLPAAPVVPTLAKLSPATNNNTGRGVASLISPVATSRTFRSFSPYFKSRENVTWSHELELSGAGSAAGLPSLPGGPFNRSATTRDHSGCAAREVPVVIASKAQIIKLFIITNHAYSRPSIPPRSGDLTAYTPAMTTPLSFNPAPSWRQRRAADLSPDRQSKERDGVDQKHPAGADAGDQAAGNGRADHTGSVERCRVQRHGVWKIALLDQFGDKSLSRRRIERGRTAQQK